MSTAFRIACVYLYGNICRIKYNYTTVLDKWKVQTFVLSVAHVICQSLCHCVSDMLPVYKECISLENGICKHVEIVYVYKFMLIICACLNKHSSAYSQQPSCLN